MSFRDGALFARLAADNPAVNQLLRDKAHELQRVLRELGLNADQVNVAISSDSERREYEQDQNGFSKRNEGSSQSGAGVLGGAVQGLSQNGDAPADEDHWVA
jgi:flagellar hook-length control protein FliK